MTTSLSEWDDEAEELGHWTSALVDGIRTPIWVPHCPIHVECEQPCRVCAAPLSPAEGEE
jgi:hypothetical protein